MSRRNWLWAVPAALALAISSACSDSGGVNSSPEADAAIAGFVASYAVSVGFFCECAVENGDFDTIGECQAVYPFFADEECLRTVATEIPELLVRAECAAAATVDLAACTDLAVCDPGNPNPTLIFAEFNACYATWGGVDGNLGDCPEPVGAMDAWLACFSGALPEPSI